ncbi:MAG: hypothetical protein KBD76_04260 [Bacteriovorax sp.]|nr:hypothetical protein [Bacteriovorax sp.]
MNKPTKLPTYTALILALLTLAASVYFNHEWIKKFIEQNDSKSKLTTEQLIPSKSSISSLLQKKLNASQNSKNLPSESILLQERLFTEAEVQKMSQEDFRFLLLETQKKLPKIHDLKKLPPSALHFTPPLVLQAGRELGLIKEILSIHETYEPLTFSFYQNCAKDKDGITPIRALCLTNLIELKKKNGIKLNLLDYPQNIIDLSRMVIE